MTAKHSTQRPEKPYPEFPLFAAANGQWAKKYKGTRHYCGPWSDPSAALKRWTEIRNQLEVGNALPAKEGALTVKSLMFAFLDAKQSKVDRGDLTARSLDDYRRRLKWLTEQLGPQRLVESLSPADFTTLRGKFPESWQYVAIKHHVMTTRTVFKWAYENDRIDKPMKFGDAFKPPAKKRQKQERRSKPRKEFTASEIHRLIDTADNPQLAAMILLGLNCGFGNADCSRLEVDDIKGVWLDVPRVKTGHERKAWLWPETRAALKAVLKDRKESNVKPGCENLVFRTHHGGPWSDETSSDSALGKAFGKLKKAAKCDRVGVGFYSLRHVFRTVADETLDFPAARLVMGHESGDGMDSTYRESISDNRVRKVCQHVRQWFLAGTPKSKGGAK